MIVGVAQIFALAAAQKFGGAVGYNLVDVHICGCARSALYAVRDKAVVEFARQSLVAGGDNRLPPMVREIRPDCMLVIAAAFLIFIML